MIKKNNTLSQRVITPWPPGCYPPRQGLIPPADPLATTSVDPATTSIDPATTFFVSATRRWGGDNPSTTTKQPLYYPLITTFFMKSGGRQGGDTPSATPCKVAITTMQGRRRWLQPHRRGMHAR
jgi:hypothetical protein